MPVRIPTIKACIKRLQSITLNDLSILSTRDLKALVKLNQLMSPIQIDLMQREMTPPRALHRNGVSMAAIANMQGPDNANA